MTNKLQIAEILDGFQVQATDGDSSNKLVESEQQRDGNALAATTLEPVPSEVTSHPRNEFTLRDAALNLLPPKERARLKHDKDRIIDLLARAQGSKKLEKMTS